MKRKYRLENSVRVYIREYHAKSCANRYFNDISRSLPKNENIHQCHSVVLIRLFAFYIGFQTINIDSQDRYRIIVCNNTEGKKRFFPEIE